MRISTAADRIREDLEALSQVPHRFAGSPGERAMLDGVRARLPDGAAARVEGFVAFTSPGLVLGIHAGALLLAALLGLAAPLSGLALGALATASLYAEGTGKRSLLRWILPKQASYNLAVRAAAERPVGTVILTAPLDVPRWRIRGPSWFRRPLQAVLIAGGVLVGLLALRALALPWGGTGQGIFVGVFAVLLASFGVGASAHRRPGELAGDASGPAVLLELVRRFRASPVAGVDVWFAFTGCGHAYQNGMHAFLAMRGDRLTKPILVLALDDPGRAPLGAVVTEGPLFPEHHRPTGPALVERLRWAGLQIPSIDHPEVTDARAALRWGYRALALAGGDGLPSAEMAAKAADVTEALVRLYAYDVARTADFAPLVGELALGPAPEPAAPEEHALTGLLGRLRARVGRRVGAHEPTPPEVEPAASPAEPVAAASEPAASAAAPVAAPADPVEEP